MLTRYEKRAGVIGCPYSIKYAMLKVKKSVKIFFFKRNAKYINYHTFSDIPLTPRLQKVIFVSLTKVSYIEESLFKRCFCRRRRCGILNSLLSLASKRQFFFFNQRSNFLHELFLYTLRNTKF